ncbi:KAP family P-loop domain protein [Acinetobacter junii]|uniref:P-loop NTPase fold protein n=1 Tax=Acinetobacter junii TaxID=40215 RepID=UPI00125ED682|nr:P-loop NTPase fold protein [Acinetobacter junii]QQV64904.1 KAP family P-loop domain protein [Acinetobacter junii]
MDILEKEERLKGILEHNIKNEKIGTAIAITGPWGVGKTFFWKRCIDGYNFKKKYVYISLFGLESLSDLKTHIYSNIENNHSTLDIPRWIRGLPSILKDTRVSQFGLSASTKIFDSLMFNQVKDAIICFDDFERMSNKLDIKDVMGLANYLKLEKNCQIILILDEDKAEGDNKKKYADYKEKLVDETIVINSVEHLIRANSIDVGIDEPLVELMIEFAEALEIHNFRFFQKVLKLYQQFRKELGADIALSTKEIILVRVLQGYLIQDFTNFEYSWSDCRYYSNKDREDWSEIKQQKYEALKKISYNFTQDDLWFYEFKKWFEQVDGIDFDKLKELAQSDLILDKNNQKKDSFHELFDHFWGLKIDDNFTEKLYFASQQVIALESLHNLSFALKILEQLGDVQKANLLEKQVMEWMKLKLKENKKFFNNMSSLGEVKKIFQDFLSEYEEQNKFEGLPSLVEVIYRYIYVQSWSSEHVIALEGATRNDWKEVLFELIPYDNRFHDMNTSQVVTQMLKQSMKPELNSKIKQMIIDVYKEKGQESEFHQRYMDYLILRLKD